MSTLRHRFQHPIEAAAGCIESWRQQHRKYPKGRQLINDAITFYRANTFAILGILALVIIPTTLLSNYSVDPSGDTTLAAYITFAELAMNAALIYALVEIVAGRKVGVREAYYKGSHAIVRLILVALLLALMIIPLGIGLLIISAGLLAPGAQLVLGEKVLLTALAIAISLPTIIWVLRGFMALYIIFEQPVGPWDAVRQSFRLTRGKTVFVLRRSVLLALALIVGLIVPAVLLIVLGSLTKHAIFVVILQILIALIVLPISNLYFYSLYRNMK